MSILIFIPLTLIAVIAERPRKPSHRSAYRPHARTIHHGRSH